ncbi:hypothetical protein ENUP19_0121G0122 [Entamoeba nuttalli]|uniref:Ras guanine nucleotide exchange factor glfB-like C-terminal domain-containing protein n=2 Tax=Entamoeba nuttalli TaxID=412467 RepID=K2GFL7_ENTNP|nr:hypothetical protein ENU1_054250 [Entamoeba nuttalli P19]EKE41486.1 hypothetical protein ENU1_054250 [Entamoeba nuttalli P19]|eukprot:XP_008856174.1 hypothetical protein ENU1_054250 [Entamoeba nuttalli P19]
MEVIYLTLILIIIIAILTGMIIGVSCLFKPKKNKTGYTKFDPERYQRTELTFTDMYKRILSLHEKPMAETSVAIDIPRLVSKLTVIEENNTILDGSIISTSHEEETYGMESTLKEVVSLLIKKLDGKEFSEEFDKQFDIVFTYIHNNGNGDCGTFFKRLLPIVFTENSLCLAVMKTFTQALFAAAVEYLLPLRLKHQYHDGYTGWRICLTIEPQEIIIKHIKGEKSYKENAFSFEWSLTYVVDRLTHKITSVEIQIFNTQFNNYPINLQQDFYHLVDQINENSRIN